MATKVAMNVNKINAITVLIQINEPYQVCR